MYKKAIDIKNLCWPRTHQFCAPGEKKPHKRRFAVRWRALKKPFLHFHAPAGNHSTNQSTTRNFDAWWISGGKLTVRGGV